MNEKTFRATGRKLRRIRQVSQGIFLALFLFLLLKTEYQGQFGAEAVEQIRLAYPVRLFLEIDPLAGISTAITTHTLYKGLIWSVGVLCVTLLIGRFFCGWICPLGTLNHLVSAIKPSRRGRRRVERNRWKPWQSVKFYILIGVLVAALFTSLLTGLLDPISLLIRSLAVSILPALNYGIRKSLDALAGTGIGFLQALSDYGYRASGATVLSFRQPYYHVAYLLGLVFLTVLFLNRFITRFWCRGICPLGALLGLASRVSLFGMEKRNERCTKCNRCLLHCQGACEPQGFVKWLPADCHLCFNCQAECPEEVIRFRFFPKEEAIESTPDMSRRRILTAAAAGVVAVPLLRSGDDIDTNYNARLIRPPGSLEEKEFLERCVRCGACMKVCPNNALHPTLFEAGLEGIWSPILIPRIGYCEHTCVLCGHVCPTGAIIRLDEDRKLGRDGMPPVKIGTAFYDRGRCLPWAMAIPCIVCEEHCPTSPKAIWLEETEVPGRDGKMVKVQLPRVDPKLCIGCGVCATKCPVQDRPAIYVTNIGETRSRTNQILLQRT